MRVIAYLRVSSDKQVSKNRDGISAQRYACEQYANVKNQTIYKFFEDPGYSGALPIHRRPGLTAALNELKTGDIFLVYRTDRLARSKTVLYDIKREISSKKCKFVSTAGEGTDSTGEYDLNAGISEDTAEYLLSIERRLAKVRTKNKMDEKRSKNECIGHIPFGLRLATDGIHLEPDPKEQEVLLNMYQLRENGYTIRKAAEYLNEKNLFNRGNTPWGTSSFFRIVSRNRAVVKQI